MWNKICSFNKHEMIWRKEMEGGGCGVGILSGSLRCLKSRHLRITCTAPRFTQAQPPGIIHQLLHQSPGFTFSLFASRHTTHTCSPSGECEEQIASLVEYWCHACHKKNNKLVANRPCIVMNVIMNLIERFQWTRSIRGPVCGLNIPNAWLSSACKMYTFSCLITHRLRHEEDSLRITIKIARIFHFEIWQSTQD